MKQYTIMRTAGKPEWNNIPELAADCVLWEPDSGIRAGAAICYDRENLYVLLKAAEKDIRAEYTGPLSPVHEDSCLEFFFRPEKEERYLNFEINPNGCFHIGFGKSRQSRIRVIPPDAGKQFCIRTDRTPEGWQAEYRIPVDFLKIFYPDFRCAGMLRANVYKCGDKTAHVHYLAWNPVNTESPDFHRPECFGRMDFEGRKGEST